MMMRWEEEEEEEEEDGWCIWSTDHDHDSALVEWVREELGMSRRRDKKEEEKEEEGKYQRSEIPSS